METIPLYLKNLSAYTALSGNYVIENFNSGFCKVALVFHCWTLQATAWILIPMAIERLLSVKLSTYGPKTFNSKKAIILSTSIILVFFFTNIWLCFSYDLQFDNSTSTNVCVNMYPGMSKQWTQHNIHWSECSYIVQVF